MLRNQYCVGCILRTAMLDEILETLTVGWIEDESHKK